MAGKIAQDEEHWRACMAGVRAKDSGALAQLYDGTAGVLYGLALRMLNDPETAEEVVLGVYRSVWNSVETIDEASGSILASLILLTRKRALERIRQAPASVPIEGHHNWTGENAWPAGAWRRKRQQIRGALETIPPEDRESVELAFFRGLTADELAAQLGTPVDTIRRRIYAGMRKLREALTAPVSQENAS
jgi:RNA polymerase sigma-70 factor, ECF subfamily